MSQIIDSWHTILAWIQNNVPDATETLNPGVSQEEFEATQQALGVQFPDSVREFYSICNGQHTYSSPILPAFYFFLSLAGIQESWELWKRLSTENPQLVQEIPIEEYRSIIVSASPAIRGCYWNWGWIPVACCLTGDLYCLDFAPTSQGQPGQIIEVWHDADMRPLIATSFENWLSKYAFDLQNNVYIYDESSGLIRKRQE